MLLSAGVELPKGWAVGGWLLSGGEKMSKTSGNVVNPLDLIDDIGLDGFRYYVLAETPYGQDGDFTYEGLVGPVTTADLANNLGNLLSRVATVVGKKCAGIGPAPAPDSPLAEAAASAVEATADGWANVQPNRALDATWSLIRATNAYLEANEPWRAEAGPAVDRVMGDALEALRIVAILASPAIPTTSQAIWERLGLAGAGRRPAAPGRSGVGRLPGRSRRDEGRAALPPPRRTGMTGSGMTGSGTTTETGLRWFDNHCHLDDERLPGGTDGVIAAARAAGVHGMITVGTDAARSAAAIAVASAHDGVWATVGLHPHDAVNGIDDLVPLLDRPKGRRGRRVRPRLSLRPLTPCRAAGDVRGADPTRPRTRPPARHPHARGVGRHVRHPAWPRARPTRTIFHCFSGGIEEARRCLDLDAFLSFSGIVTFKTADELRAAARACPLDRLLVETDSPYLAPVPHRGRRNEPAHVPLVGAAVAAAAR